MIVECQNCGAPLDVRPQDWFARCQYCGQNQRVKKARTQFNQTPAGWRPPQVWTPPQHFHARSVPLNYDTGKTVRKTVLIIVLLTTFGPLPFVFIPLVCAFTGGSSSHSNSHRVSTPVKADKTKWSGRATFVCSGPEKLTLKKLRVKSKLFPAIRLKTGCELTIEDSRIEARRFAEVGFASKLTVRNSRITADTIVDAEGQEVTIESTTMTATGSPAISARTMARVHIISSKLRIRPNVKYPSTVAVSASQAAEVDFESTKLELRAGRAGGEVIFVHVDTASKVSFRDAEIKLIPTPRPGKAFLFKASNVHANEIQGGSIHTGGLPLLVQSNSGVNVTGTHIHGQLRRSGRGKLIIRR